MIQAIFSVLLLISLPLPGHAQMRQYYLAAEEEVWDFAPSGQNLVHCHPDPEPCPLPEPWTNSHRFPVVRFVQYSDANYTTRVPQPGWLGILGPILRAEVGDELRVRLCNRASRPVGLHPHGLRYTKDQEGAHYSGVNSGQGPGLGAAISPGQCFDYQWLADAESGPTPMEPSSKVWWYHSHIHEPSDVNAGLLGPIIVTRQGWAREDGSPKDVDLEFVTAFFIFDMLQGEEAGLMHSINGYIFGNLKGLVIPYGKKVRWHLLGMGNEVDLHTPHWHGKTVELGRLGQFWSTQRTDVIALLPAQMVTADMLADNPGEWLFHCHVADHIDAGMVTTYQILPP
ncbi:MAG: multicopper oxidase domain-containing protein [Methylohalobius sp.]|nr:multicopper oxidase domain-containing protein [Methylohalobius sp.]